MIDSLKLKIERLDNAKDLPLPQYQTEGSSGIDLHANVKEDVIIKKGDICMISVGFKMHLPKGYEAQVRGRSSLGSKYGVALANGVGTIDSDYRGEVFVPLINLGKDDFTVMRGDRVAQMIITKYSYAHIFEGDVLNDTERGAEGFGSTGK